MKIICKLLALLAALPCSAAVSNTSSEGTFAKLPIREVTVFKDGHAFVAHEGEMPTDGRGDVVMDYLPTPVIGTFWPYSAEKDARLSAVVAGQRRVEIKRTALQMRELLEGNIGARAIVTEHGTNRYEATILGLPERSSQELAGTSPPGSVERLPEKGALILLKTADGTRVVPVDRIQEITFKGDHEPKFTSEEFRNVLRLKLDWGRKKAAAKAQVGLFYMQKGIRWIPSYKVDIDGAGKATLKLQATLINELADLEDVSLNLVVGVPTVAFKEVVDPMALQQTLSHLSHFFQSGSVSRNSPIASQFSNAIMSQTIAPVQSTVGASGGGALDPGVAEADRKEDLFVFTVQHVSLRRGERLVLTIAEMTTPYRDVFTLDMPIQPPMELMRGSGFEQQRELSRLQEAPKVMHKVRLSNESKIPFTTAPALILRQGKVLGQGLMTYTSPGGKVDLPVTAALEFQVTKTEKETKRTPDAFRANGTTYSRVDLSGRVAITSFREKVEAIEVTREVFGMADSADASAKSEQMSMLEQRFEQPSWWGWYSWPYWAYHHNGVARFTWTIKLNPKESAELNYNWHYFWN